MGQALCTDARAHVDIGPNFKGLPIETAYRIFQYLSAQDLCSAALVNTRWALLANSTTLWKRQCIARVRCLNISKAEELGMTWKQIYKIMQAMIYCFNTDAVKGLAMFGALGLITHDDRTVAQFLRWTSGLDRKQVGRYLTREENSGVLQQFTMLEDCASVFLADALRAFLLRIDVPVGRSRHRQVLIETFADHYHASNPQLALSHETILLLCFSLVLLDTDLTSPHIKNKMSKREFIKNLRRVNPADNDRICDDYLGLLYDCVYLEGLLTPRRRPLLVPGSASSIDASSSSSPRAPRCHAVFNHATLTASQEWQLTPRVVPLYP